MQQAKINSDITRLEDEYFALRTEILLMPDITPINIQQEKATFFAKFTKGERYNPQFTYEQSDNIRHVKQISAIREKFAKVDHALVPWYLEKLDYVINWIENFDQRESPHFPEWLGSVYQKPEQELFDKAAEIDQGDDAAKEPEIFDTSPQEVRDAIEAELRKYEFNNWEVEVTHMTARMSVNSILKKVKINQDKKFSAPSIQRLCIHEIGTHVFRNENGSQQPYQIFKYGLPDYLDTEEGLAIWSEYTNGVRIPHDDIRYRLRLMASYKCFEMDFFDLYQYVSQYLDKNTSFDLVTRIKRGLRDTGIYGGYTKDQVYFKGFLKVDQLERSDLSKLYLGKIGIDHLPLLEEMDELNWDFSTPPWV